MTTMDLQNMGRGAASLASRLIAEQQNAAQNPIPFEKRELKPLDISPSDFAKKLDAAHSILEKFLIARRVWNTESKNDATTTQTRLMAGAVMIATVDAALAQSPKPKELAQELLAQTMGHKYNVANYPYEDGIFVRQVGMAMTGAATKFTHPQAPAPSLDPAI